MPRIGLITSGGDCPGLNAAIRAVTRQLINKYDAEVIGIRNGFSGLVEGSFEPVSLYSVSGILPRGGTILGTSRIDPLADPRAIDDIKSHLDRYEIDAMVVIGDRDAIDVSHKLTKHGLNIVCIPATIDNDIAETGMCFGFSTAVKIATEAIDRLHSTADSHHRVMVVEVMGRETGWIATYAGLAGGADIILIPEIDTSIDEICSLITKRHARRSFSIVVVAEGANPVGVERLKARDEEISHQHGVGECVAREIEKRTEVETRIAVLGHIQRGGTPTSADRILATRLGVKAADFVVSGEYNVLVGLRDARVRSMSLDTVAGRVKKVDPDMYEIASVFFG
ncbi:MAG TPA: 6-phosphofructokinase [Bacteroidetes bacterium]|nr:6-phosphofructokinase [Bacteroidota bacterium]